MGSESAFHILLATYLELLKIHWKIQHFIIKVKNNWQSRKHKMLCFARAFKMKSFNIIKIFIFSYQFLIQKCYCRFLRWCTARGSGAGLCRRVPLRLRLVFTEGSPKVKIKNTWYNDHTLFYLLYCLTLLCRSKVSHQ